MGKGTLKLASIDGVYTPREIRVNPQTGELGIVDNSGSVVWLGRKDLNNITEAQLADKLQPTLNGINQSLNDANQQINLVASLAEQVNNKLTTDNDEVTSASYYNAPLVDDKLRNKKSKIKGVMNAISWEINATNNGIVLLEPIQFMLDDFSKYTLTIGEYLLPPQPTTKQVLYVYGKVNEDNIVTMDYQAELLDYKTPNYVLLGSLFYSQSGGLWGIQVNSLVDHPYIISNSTTLRESKHIGFTGGKVTMFDSDSFSLTNCSIFLEGIGSRDSLLYPNKKAFHFDPALPVAFTPVYPNYVESTTVNLPAKWYNSTINALQDIPSGTPWVVYIPYLVPNGQVLLWMPQGSTFADCCFGTSAAATNAIYNLNYNKTTISSRGVFFGVSIVHNVVTGESFVFSSLPAILGGSYTGSTGGIPELANTINVNGTTVNNLDFEVFQTTFDGSTAKIRNNITHNLGEIFVDGFVDLKDGQGWCEGAILPSSVYSGLVAEFDKHTADNTKGVYWVDFVTYETILSNNDDNCVFFGYDSVNNLVRLPKIRDFSTASTKQIVGWNIPNYSISENFTSNVDFIAPNKGIIVFCGLLADNRNRALSINSQSIFNTATSGSYLNGWQQGSIWLVDKGDIILATNATGLKFYSFKGNNITPIYGGHKKYKIQLANVGVPASESQYANFVDGLTNKADKDLNNTIPSQAFKETVVGWGMPDYSSGVDIKSSVVSVNGYTCVSSGQCFFRGNSNYNLTIIINGKTVMVNSTPTGFALGFAFNVDKGDVIKGNNVYSAQFFPLKGVN